ncbi:MAG TPA: sulfotransferase [Polyangia bacterium]|nr:sulfotransferase [Polyangia bacterium]
MSTASGDVPFFIVGSERSGTTLLMAMLGCHPRLAVPEVCWWYPRFRRHLHTYGDLRRPANLRVLAEEMVFGLKTPFWGMPVNPRTIVDEIVARAAEPTFVAIYRAMFQRYAEHVGKPRWGEKTPHNLYFVADIAADFPGARFVHLIRDGRDVAVEQLRSAFGPRNVYAAASLWKQSMAAGAAARTRVPPEQWLDVRYEALVAEPERELRRVLAFLGETFDPAVLRHQDSTIARQRAETRDHRPLGEPVTRAYVGIHRRHLSLEEQAVFAGVAGGALRESGYPVDVAPVFLDESEAARQIELDGRIRAATLDAPDGHIAYESYNDWLVDQREARRRAGVWPGPPERITWADELISGQRAPRLWKDYFAVKRRYVSEGKVL